MHDLNSSAKLLEMVASKLGYANIRLQSGFGTDMPNYCVAKFGFYGSFRTTYVRADGQLVWIARYSKWDGRCDACMCAELVKTLYKTLERNGIISDGKQALAADDVPEFMIGCVLNGIA